MKEAQDKKEKVLVISQAAEYLGVSIDTVRRWDRIGLLHAIRAAGKTRYFSFLELVAVKNKVPLAKVTETIDQTKNYSSFVSKVLQRGIILLRFGFLIFILITILFLLVPNETAKILTTVFNTIRL